MRWLDDKFKNKPLLAEANKLAMKAGYTYCEATEAFQISYEIPPAKLRPGVYRNISGNQALALGFVAASQKAGLRLFQGSYPITPASDILHELSQYKDFGVITFQAEDEIAAVTSAIGAAYGGALALTTTSGPGMALKTEAIGLAVMTEMPLVICDIQRGGPSPACRPRPSRPICCRRSSAATPKRPCRYSPPSTPGDCFWVAMEACRIAVKYMVPVIILSDGYLANGAEPWRIPERRRDAANSSAVRETEPRRLSALQARSRNAGASLGRSRARRASSTASAASKSRTSPATSTTSRSTTKRWCALRAAKVEAIVQDVPDVVPAGDADGDLLIVALGLDLRRDHRRRERAARAGRTHRPRASAPSQSAAARISARCIKRYKQGAGPGNEHGPDCSGCCAPSISSTP